MKRPFWRNCDQNFKPVLGALVLGEISFDIVFCLLTK
jgi:hypothetical protein